MEVFDGLLTISTIVLTTINGTFSDTGTKI